MQSYYISRPSQLRRERGPVGLLTERGHPVRQRAQHAQASTTNRFKRVRATRSGGRMSALHLIVYDRSSQLGLHILSFNLRVPRANIPLVMKKRYLLAGVSGIVAGAVATKLLTRPRDVSWPESIDLIYNAEYSWFTTIGGVRIHYQEAGDENAPPVILIHGFISSNLIWSDLFLPLACAGGRVIAPHLPGYGYSDKPSDARYTIDAQAYAVLGLMDRLGIDHATI